MIQIKKALTLHSEMKHKGEGKGVGREVKNPLHSDIGNPLNTCYILKKVRKNGQRREVRNPLHSDIGDHRKTGYI